MFSPLNYLIKNVAFYEYAEVLKVIATSALTLVVKFKKPDDTISTLGIDFSNLKQDIEYTGDLGKLPMTAKLVVEPNSTSTLFITFKSANNKVSGFGWYHQDNPQFPVYLYLNYDTSETETPETPTKTVVFSPPETVEQFFERVYARLLHLTRRIRILRHEEPHQNALSTKICREVPTDHAEVLRYDIACNLIKRPVGWLALQLENYQTRYTRHLEAVVKAEEAGRTPPTFNRGSDETKIEAMLEKLETNLTEECLENHFDLHDHGEWDKIQNKQRKITLCDDDYSPGEVLVDVNSFFTDGDGNIAETHAKRTYHDISTKYWVKAKRTPHRNLVTQRTVEL